MAINFPSSPTIGNTYTVAEKTWQYNGKGWVLTSGPAGLQGVQGPQGDTGPQGPPGADGAPGAAGADGQGLALQGSVANSAALPGSGVAGDCWITADTGHLWTWSVSGSAWVDAGNIQGPAGADGAT